METVKACGFSKVGGLYIENLAASVGEFNNYSNGSFSHNMEWITYEAVEFINAEAQAVSTMISLSLSNSHNSDLKRLTLTVFNFQPFAGQAIFYVFQSDGASRVK